MTHGRRGSKTFLVAGVYGGIAEVSIRSAYAVAAAKHRKEWDANRLEVPDFGSKGVSLIKLSGTLREAARRHSELNGSKNARVLR
jgi:hypothetical protein